MKGRVIREKPVEKFIGRAGFISIGYKDTEGRPRSRDYFSASGEYANEFHEKFGDEPRRLMIVFPSNDPNEVCKEELECRGVGKGPDQGKLLAYGDRETFQLWNHEKKDYVTTTRAQMPPKLGRWSHKLTLKFMLPELSSVFGFWQMTTQGEDSSIPNIIGVFDKICEKTNLVSRIPFDLLVQFATSQKPGSMSRYPVLSLIPRLGQTELQKVQELGGQIKTLGGLLTADVVHQLEAAPGVQE